MSGEAWLYLFAVIINAVNLFLQVFFTIMYSDLEWYGILGRKQAMVSCYRWWCARWPATILGHSAAPRHRCLRSALLIHCDANTFVLVATTSTPSTSATVSTRTSSPKSPSMDS